MPPTLPELLRRTRKIIEGFENTQGLESLVDQLQAWEAHFKSLSDHFDDVEDAILAKHFLESQGIDFNLETVGQLMVMMEALKIYHARESVYGGVWKQYGALANLVRSATKLDRTMRIWWTGEDEYVGPSKVEMHKNDLDDSYDAINHLIFFIRLARNGNIHGSTPSRPADKMCADTDCPAWEFPHAPHPREG